MSLVTGNDKCLTNSFQSFSIDITNGCNKNCSFCVYHKEGDEVQFMTKTTFNKFAGYLQQYLGTHPFPEEVCLFGGEPTLHPHLIEFATTLKALELPPLVRVQSNLSASVKEYENILAIVDELVLTLHVDDQDNEKVLNTLWALEKYGKKGLNKIEVFFMFTNESLTDKIPLHERVKDMFYTELHFLTLKEGDNADPICRAYWRKDSEDYRKDHKIVNLQGGYIYEEFFDDIYPFKQPKVLCNSGLQVQYIDVQGNIYRCDMYKLLEKNCLGNVNDAVIPPITSCICEEIACSRDWHLKREVLDTKPLEEKAIYETENH